MTVPLISIVIPTYNNGHFFHRLLNCLLNQSYENWEAIIIDNNSIDSTLSIISEFNDNRFKVYRIQNGGIIAKSRNLGIQKAKGEWIAFLDSDDWWDSNKLSYCSDFFEFGVDLIYHKMEIVSEFGSSRTKYLYSRKARFNFHNDLLLNGNFIPNSSVIVKKHVLLLVGGINEDKEMVGSEDFHLWLKITRVTNKAKYISKKLGYYYIGKGGVSQKNMTSSYEYALKDFMIDCRYSEKLIIKAHLSYMEAKFLMKTHKYDNVNSLLIFCIKHGSLLIKTKSLYFLSLRMFKIIKKKV